MGSGSKTIRFVPYMGNDEAIRKAVEGTKRVELNKVGGEDPETLSVSPFEAYEAAVDLDGDGKSEFKIRSDAQLELAGPTDEEKKGTSTFFGPPTVHPLEDPTRDEAFPEHRTVLRIEFPIGASEKPSSTWGKIDAGKLAWRMGIASVYASDGYEIYIGKERASGRKDVYLSMMQSKLVNSWLFSVAVGDFNGDGLNDFAIISLGVSVFLQVPPEKKPAAPVAPVTPTSAPPVLPAPQAPKPAR